MFFEMSTTRRHLTKPLPGHSQCEQVFLGAPEGVYGSPVTSDKQVGNLVFLRHKKNPENPQRAKDLRPKADFLPLSPTRILLHIQDLL